MPQLASRPKQRSGLIVGLTVAGLFAGGIGFVAGRWSKSSPADEYYQRKLDYQNGVMQKGEGYQFVEAFEKQAEQDWKNAADSNGKLVGKKDRDQSRPHDDH